MTEFISNNQNRDRQPVEQDISNMLQNNFPGFQPTLPGRLYAYFLQLKTEDILVAIEGVNVRGVCCLEQGFRYNFCEDPEIEYAHQFGPVKWVDWNAVSPNWTPQPPAQGVLAIANARQDGEEISTRYHFYIQQRDAEQKMQNWAALLRAQRQIIFTGPPGTGKTLLAKRLAAFMLTSVVPDIDKVDEILKPLQMPFKEGQPGAWDIVQFHPSYNYDDFVRGIRIRTNEQRQTEYTVKNGPLLQMAQQAADERKQNFILIIDEINRANVAAVLGEMIYALEYRGQPVALQYGDDGTTALLPDNVYVIGTMNTADRSIGHIDYAVRRRFAFVYLGPAEWVIESHKYESEVLRGAALSKFKAVAALFKGEQALLSGDYRAEDVQPGHSYFLVKDQDDLNRRMKYQVGPLLREYVADGVLKTAAIEKIGEIEGGA